MILADTSLWIAYRRNIDVPAVGELDDRLAARDVLMCGPVASELLVGEDPSERMRLWDRFAAMPWIDVDRTDFFVAGEVAAELRAQGRAVPLSDALIAAAAATRATLWTFDRHFERIGDVLDGLDLRLLDGA